MRKLIRHLFALLALLSRPLRNLGRWRYFPAALAGTLLVISAWGCSRPSEPAPSATASTTGPDQAATSPASEETAAETPRPAPSLPETSPSQPSASPGRLRGSETEPAPPFAAQRGGLEGRLSRGAWWHQKELSESLALSAEQARQLDALKGDRSAEVRQAAEAMRGAREKLESALAAGDWEAARHAFEEQATAGVILARAQGELTIAAFEILSPEQRRKAVEKLPQILRQPWAAGAGRERRGRPGDRPADKRPLGERPPTFD